MNEKWKREGIGMEEREGGMKNEKMGREGEKERGKMCEVTEERRKKEREKIEAYLKEREM